MGRIRPVPAAALVPLLAAGVLAGAIGAGGMGGAGDRDAGPSGEVAAARPGEALADHVGDAGAAPVRDGNADPGRAARATRSGDLPGTVRHVFTRPLMGTTFRIVLHAADSAEARRAARRAFARIAELEGVLSDYDPGSEMSRLSATAGEGRWVPVSGDLWWVLSTARAWSARTDGAFDVTVGALTRLWRRSARRGTVPPAEAVETALRSVGWERLRLDPERGAVRLEAPGSRLDAGGIGKGWAADRALELLAALGFPRALVDAGGDVLAGEPPPGEAGWRVEVRGARGAAAGGGSPAAAGAEPCVVRLAGAALATSGDTERFVEVDGVRHSHILDPRTGAALTHRRLVTVLAPTATEADILASALSVLSPSEGRRLVRSVPGSAARVLEPDGDGVHLRVLAGPATGPFRGCGVPESLHGATVPRAARRATSRRVLLHQPSTHR